MCLIPIPLGCLFYSRIQVISILNRKNNFRKRDHYLIDPFLRPSICFMLIALSALLFGLIGWKLSAMMQVQFIVMKSVIHGPLKWAVIYQTGAFKKLKVDGPQPFIFTQQLLTVLVQFSWGDRPVWFFRTAHFATSWRRDIAKDHNCNIIIFRLQAKNWEMVAWQQ